MKGKLLRGISGSIQPRRLLHGYQDAVFAWSGENPFANLSQGSPYKILQRSQYNSDWLHSTPHGQAFRSPTYDHSEGYVFSSHVPDAPKLYEKGVTGYVEFIYTGAPAPSQNAQHFTITRSNADGDTGSLYSGVIAFGCELVNSSMRHFFRLANNETFVGFAGGESTNAVPIDVPVGARVRQMATFNTVDKSYSAIMAFDDVVYTTSGVLPSRFNSAGSTVLIGGYTRLSSIRAAYTADMLSAAVWRRPMSFDEMASLLQRPSIFQPTEFIFPFSFGEPSDESGIIKCSKPNLVVSANAAQIIWSETINCTTSELILSSKDCAIVLNDPPLIFDTDDYPDRYVFDVYQTPPDVDVIACTSADITIQTNSCIIVDAENINCSPHPLTLNAYNCDIFETALNALNCLKAELNLQTNICAVLQSEIINCVSHNLDLSSNTTEIAEKSVIESTVSNISLIAYDCDIQAFQHINCNQDSFLLQAQSFELLEKEFIFCSAASLSLQNTICNIVEQGLDVISCSKNVTLLSANKCNIVQEDLDVIYCNESTLQISGNKFSTAETDIISCQVANLSLLANKSFVADTQSIFCQEYSISLVSNICNIVEAGLDVIHAKRADLRLEPINCEIIEFGFDNIFCNVGNVKLTAQSCDIYDIEIINCVSTTLDVQSSSCDIVEEGLNVVHCKKADIELISNKCSIAENEIISCEQSLVTTQTKKCQIIEFVDFRAAKLDLISNSSSVLSNEVINCSATVININSKRALVVDSNIPPILWSGKIVITGYVEPIRGIA